MNFKQLLARLNELTRLDEVQFFLAEFHLSRSMTRDLVELWCRSKKVPYPNPPSERLRPDKFHRYWPFPDAELCDTCGQPDSYGDCNHEDIGDEDAAKFFPYSTNGEKT